jgi:hypothetical protein
MKQRNENTAKATNKSSNKDTTTIMIKESQIKAVADI